MAGQVKEGSRAPQRAGAPGDWEAGRAELKKGQRTKTWKLTRDSMMDPRIQRELGRSLNPLSPEENRITRKRLWMMTGFGFQAGCQVFP